MTRSNLLATALIGLLLVGSVALQVSTREDVSDLGSRVQRVEKVIACEQRADCRAFIRQVVRGLLADAQRAIKASDPKGGGSPSTPSASSQPPPPSSDGGGPDNPGGGNPPPAEPPPDPSPLSPVCQLTPQLCDLLP